MSRLVGLGFVLCDIAATVFSMFNACGTLLVIVLSVLTSITIGTFSWMVRSTIWPTYFWDAEELAAPRKAPVRATTDRLS